MNPSHSPVFGAWKVDLTPIGHVIWDTDKDFGISGFHFGALYPPNMEVASAVSAFGFLHSISGITQHKLCWLLHDREWTDKVYLLTNRSQLTGTTLTG